MTMVESSVRVEHQAIWRAAADGYGNQFTVYCRCGLPLGRLKVTTKTHLPAAQALVLRWLLAHIRDVDYGAPCGRLGCSERVTDHHLGLCGEHARVAYRQVGRGRLRD